MSCRVSLERLALYLTRAENGRGDRLALHIAHCPECSGRMRVLQETGGLADGAGMVPPPPDMWERIAPRLSPKACASRSWRSRVAVSVTAALAVAAAVFLQVRPAQLPGDDAQAFYQRHSALAPASAGTVLPAADVRGFEVREHFRVHRPGNLPAGWKLVRLESFHCRRGLPVAHQVYRKDGSLLSIFEKPSAGGPGFGMGRGQCPRAGGGGCGRCLMRSFGGHQMVISAGARRRFFVMGDLPVETLQQIARDLAGQAE